MPVLRDVLPGDNEGSNTRIKRWHMARIQERPHGGVIEEGRLALELGQ